MLAPWLAKGPVFLCNGVPVAPSARKPVIRPFKPESNPMPYLFRVLIASLLLLFVMDARAQSTMTIDGNCQFPLSTSGTSVAINPSTGNVTVSSQSGVNCNPSNATLTLPSSATVGTNFVVSWTSTGTTSCTPSGGGSSNWATQGTLPTSGNRTITAPGTPATNVSFTISCATGGTPAVDTKTMNFTNIPGFVDLLAPSTVPTTTSFNVSWTSSGTTGATPCTPSGGGATAWASQGPLPATGQRTLTAPASAGSAQFTISCATGSTPVMDSETVTFQGGGGVVCNGVAPPPGISQGGISNWTNLYNGSFPLPQNAQSFLTINRGSARAIRIVVPTPCPGCSPSILAAGFGLWTNISGPDNAKIVTSISPCPYDFRESVLNTSNQTCMSPPLRDAQIDYYLGAGSPFPQATCSLNVGQTYYINFHAGSGSTADATGAFCALTSCTWTGGGRQGLQTTQTEGDDQ
jgi:hypothetical protein